MQAEKSLRSELEDNLRDQMNAELSKIPVNLTSSQSERLVDGLLDRAAQEIRTMGADPFALPEQNHKFQQDLLLFSAHGEAHLTHGQLYGLSTIHRTGDLLAYYQDGILIFEADLGFHNLTGSCRWWAHLLGAGMAGHPPVMMVKTKIVSSAPIIGKLFLYPTLSFSAKNSAVAYRVGHSKGI